MFTFRLCPICRQTFKRPSDLRRHLRRLHNLDQDMAETLVAKAKTETRANKRYIDPAFFLPPRVKDKHCGGIASSLSSTLPSSSSSIVPQSSFSKGCTASCNNTCSTTPTLLSDPIPFASVKEVQLPVSLQLCLLCLIFMSLHYPPFEETLLSLTTKHHVLQRGVSLLLKNLIADTLSSLHYQQQQTRFTNTSVGLRKVKIN
ncbi:hypothetical protein ACJMK2_039071 [Sinanodonta woodiana]|uniref:C2H2-type domain-containing protein n=1 Tax=Sinanodonta woodiana TaxID=1069815 RepID=A0ABD3WE82_SINWO